MKTSQTDYDIVSLWWLDYCVDIDTIQCVTIALLSDSDSVQSREEGIEIDSTDR